MKLVNHIKTFLADEHGGNAIEYGLLAALIALGIIVGATAVGTNLNALFNNIAGRFSTAIGGGGGGAGT